MAALNGKNPARLLLNICIAIARVVEREKSGLRMKGK